MAVHAASRLIVMAPAVVCLMLAIGFGAAAYRGWFRAYSIATHLIWLVEDVLATV